MACAVEAGSYGQLMQKAGENTGGQVRLKPMRKVNYDGYMEKLRVKSLHLYTQWAASGNSSARSNKPREREEDVMLFLLDYLRWQKALDSGMIEKIGTRRYRWNG
ncbi:MAG: hypothetical protein ACOY81_09765 [Bacillota bacterium]